MKTIPKAKAKKLIPKKTSAIPARWAEWQRWSSCSKTCGPGVRDRYGELLLMLQALLFKNIQKKSNLKFYSSQVQSRTRQCNIAQYGGDTSICTAPQTEEKQCTVNRKSFDDF